MYVHTFSDLKYSSFNIIVHFPAPLGVLQQLGTSDMSLKTVQVATTWTFSQSRQCSHTSLTVSKPPLIHCQSELLTIAHGHYCSSGYFSNHAV